MAEPDSSKLTSAQMKQQLKEQTRGMREAPEDIEEPTEELTEPEPAEAEEEKTEETPAEEEKPVEEQPPEKEEKPTLHKLKVEGKEEEVPYEKLIEFAQKGRHYEKEMAKLKKQREELQAEREKPKAPASPIQNANASLDPTKIKDMFLEEFANNPVGVLTQMQEFMLQKRDEKTAEDRKADRMFEQEQVEDNPVWKDIKPQFQFYRDMGYDREVAITKAENDFLRTAILNAQTAGRKEGEKKTIAKRKAEIPIGGKGAKATDTGIPDETISRMKASDLKKKIPRVRTPGF
jgi:hypothetical protein